jgi:hypothetical protein
MKPLLQLLAIATAVFIGSLTAHVVYDYILTLTATQALAELTTGKRAAASRRQAIEQNNRSESPTARDLLRRCNEFRDAHDTTNSSYARAQADATCAKYRTYVRTGRLVP